VGPLGWALQGSLEPYALEHGNPGWFVRGRYHELRTRVFESGEEEQTLHTNRLEIFGGGQTGITAHQVVEAGAGYADLTRPAPGWNGLMLAFRTQSLGGAQRTLEAEWAAGEGGYARLNAVLDLNLRYRAFVLTPGGRYGVVEGDVPPDALVGLGGPHSLSGLRRDEWLGRRAYAFSLELAIEAQRQARVYLAAQSGRVDDAVSGADLGVDGVGGAAIGATVELPIGPLQIEWGACTAGRSRLDLMLGTRF
jgi:hemolysin activation/secretion protein